MSRTWCAFALCLAAILSACAAPPSATPTPLHDDVADMFPFFIGGALTYNFSREDTPETIPIIMGTYTERVVMIETGSRDKVRIIQVERTGDDFLARCGVGQATATFWYVADRQRLYHACTETEASELAAVIMRDDVPDTPFPDYVLPFEVGKYWTWSTDVAPEVAPYYHWYVDSSGEVSVPAGKFSKCFRIALYTTPDATIRWACPGVGVVAAEYHHHPATIEYRAELAKYEIVTGP